MEMNQYQSPFPDHGDVIKAENLMNHNKGIKELNPLNETTENNIQARPDEIRAKPFIMESGTDTSFQKNISSTIENARITPIVKCENEDEMNTQRYNTNDEVLHPMKTEFIKCNPMCGNDTEAQGYDYYEIKVLSDDVVDIKVESVELQSNDRDVDSEFPMKEPKENENPQQELKPLNEITKMETKILSMNEISKVETKVPSTGAKKKIENHLSGKEQKSLPKLSQCTLCQKKTYNLTKHMIEAHSDIERPFKCYACDKTYKEFSRLRYHIRRHNNTGNYVCHICGDAFFISSDLTKHIFSRHETMRAFKCEECGESFKTRSTLQIHGRRHTGDKPFTCNVCSKGFTTSGSLKIHSRQHSGDKPYVCSFCGKSFLQSSTHRQHERIHSGVKPYKCHLCDRRTAQAGNLKSHYRYHHKMIVKRVTMFPENSNAIPVMEPIPSTEAKPVRKKKLRKKKI